MDAATQKLVDEGRWLRSRILGADEGADAMRVAEALGNLAAALEAAQRPPVSPEVREEMIAYLSTEPEDEGDPREDYLNRADATWITDAILARWSFPPQPVYDEEKVVRVLHDHSGDADMPAATRYRMTHTQAAALVAALPGLVKGE